MARYNSLPGLIEMIRRAASPKGRRLTGLYVIEGTRLLERALRAGRPPEAVLAAEHLAGSKDSRIRELFVGLRDAGCCITIAPDNLLKELTERRDLGAILGLVRLPEPVTLADLVGGCAGGHGGPPLLAAVDIVDPGNVGALTRTAHAGGAAGLLVTGASDPFHPRATRISRGSIFKLPVIAYDTASDLLVELRACHVEIAATAATGGTPLPEVFWPPGPLAVLMGNEAEGLPPAIAAAVDLRVTIPMAAGVDSYSVNAAAAIILYQIGQSQSNGRSCDEQ